MTPDPPEPEPVLQMQFTISNAVANARVFGIVAVTSEGVPVSGAPLKKVRVIQNDPQVVYYDYNDDYKFYQVYSVAYNNSRPDVDDYLLSEMTQCTLTRNGVVDSTISGSEGLINTITYTGSNAGTRTQSSE